MNSPSGRMPCQIEGSSSSITHSGAEEIMTKECHNYLFHINESLKGEVIALIVCTIVGIVIQFIL